MPIAVSEILYFVRDIDRAVSFYTEKLGYTLIEKQAWGWALLEVDPHHRIGLLKESVWSGREPGYGGMPRPRLAFHTRDLEAEVRRLKAMGVDVDDLTDGSGGARSVGFRDQDGNPFFLWEDVS